MRTAIQKYISIITNASIMYLTWTVGVLCKRIATKNQDNVSTINLFWPNKTLGISRSIMYSVKLGILFSKITSTIVTEPIALKFIVKVYWKALLSNIHFGNYTVLTPFIKKEFKITKRIHSLYLSLFRAFGFWSLKLAD